MTNEQIIFHQRMALMKEGIIGTTGRTITVEDEEGNKSTIEDPEVIHTFSEWKRRGFTVKKGEKAITKFTIWKHVVNKAKSDNEEDKERMIQKVAFFFTASQVEPIEEKQAV